MVMSFNQKEWLFMKVRNTFFFFTKPFLKLFLLDSSSFGSRMLAKMGWTKGKGLGASENGSVDFVRVKYKNDSGGFGYTARDDQWTENESGFHTLLQSLNETDEAQAERKRQSLEEKSKLSRARVHYQKFTRGKDISRYSEKDLANIFGKKNLNDSYKVENEDDEEKESNTENKGKLSQDHGTMIINTGVSITEYFKNKRKKVNDPAPESTFYTNGPVQEELTTEEVTTETQKEKNKKKKRKRQDSEEKSSTLEEVPDLTPRNNEELPEPVKKKKKKKAKEDTIPEVPEQLSIPEDSLEPKQKKKKKKKHTEEPEAVAETTKDTSSEEFPSIEEVPEVNASEKKSKKKKKICTNLPTNEDEDLNSFFLDALAVEKLKQINLEEFKESNVSNTVGYGLSDDLKLEIRDSSIVKGISNTNKYSIYTNVDKMHSKSYYKSLLLRYHRKRNTFKLE